MDLNPHGVASQNKAQKKGMNTVYPEAVIMSTDYFPT